MSHFTAPSEGSGRDFAGKTVLVTGARGRLGGAAAELLVGRGATVVGVDLPEIVGLPPVSQLPAPDRDDAPAAGYELGCDAASETEVTALAAHLRQRHERLDGVLQTTYAQAPRPIAELSLDDWNRVVVGCLTSGFLLCKHLVPLMAQGGGGVFVATSSVLAREPTVANAAYGAAKAGLAQLTRVAALENAGANVRCVVLEPGDFKTGEEIASMSQSQRGLIQRATLASRSAAPVEIARVAVFLLSDDASYVNGCVVAADGGFIGYGRAD